MADNLTSNERIRNFCIIAHIDHGKTTLADRILELTGALSNRERRDQFLDKMDLERERGITIKAQAVRIPFKSADGETYQFNLIDTPGHVDFHYEVSRSLAACEGAVLLVDASQGVEAQTLANVYMALDNELEVIPVLNKIDLPQVDLPKAQQQIEDMIGLDASNIIFASGKDGTGIREILERVVKQVPPPSGLPGGPMRALIFDSWFDSYRGVVVLVRVVDGALRPGMKIKMLSSGNEYEVQEMGVFSPFAQPVPALEMGEVGFMVANIKSITETKMGDTITDALNPSATPLKGFRETKAMVFSGLFPVDSSDYESLKDALQKLQLNDSGFTFEPESSSALGFGFRCGFLGLLHMEIVQERLEREYQINLITTAPTVVYKIVTTKGEELMLDNPSEMPDAGRIDHIEEPYVLLQLYGPQEHIGSILKLCEERRGIQKDIVYASGQRVVIRYHMPFAEIVFDFFDRLKSVTRGYASMDYEPSGYQTSNLVRIDVLINGEPVDALSTIAHKDVAYYRGRELCKKLKEVIPRQMFEVAVQAAIGSRIISRETISAMRKNVTAKCYGGDISRKRKLLEKQKEGKRRMKQVGKVDLPQDAFLAILKID